MGRIRTMKPDFFRSRSLARCPIEARLTFAGLWTEADDHGRGVADARILKGAIWSLDDDVTHEHVSAHLRVLAETDHIQLYEVDGEPYYQVVNWTKHQASAYRRGDPKHPGPDDPLADVSHDGMQERADDTQDDAGREGNRDEGTGTVAASPRNAIFEALVEASEWDMRALTDSARGRANKAAKELDEIGATPEGIRARAQVHRSKWPDMSVTPTSIAANYAELGKSSGPPSAAESIAIREYDPADAEARFRQIADLPDDRKTA